ncbi:hypothetical protein CANARDRAFT_22865 [[Candida] arabinofermentans NRRL YB-2248]|uniref:DUF3835 domain-containing protein n=1 Tax=[Candida] arabinofermentans NRRL YB-2248 TaxID=983967 RepID=A0A1E4T2X6_9ASCO|nr:hypothetical protein CANARDRAFT_22865 [[Candida] arabinofermentans NRRL YB-2248]
MESELSIIDSILYNLVATKQLHEFELNHLPTFISLAEQFKNEKLSEFKGNNNSDIFEKESTKELNYYKEKLIDLKKRVEILDKEINERKSSRKKLVDLFESLTKLNSLDQQQKQQDKSQGTVNDDTELPVMEIREELDDDDNVVSRDIKPFQDSNLELMNKIQSSIEKDTNKEIERTFSSSSNEKQKITDVTHADFTKPTDEPSDKPTDEATDDATDEFTPFMIREDLDENGIVIEGTAKQTVLNKRQQEPSTSTNDKTNDTNYDEDEDVNEDQITELLQDMGFGELVAKQSEIKTEHSSKTVDETEKSTSKKQEHSPAIDPDDLLVLEVLADDVLDNEEENGDFEYKQYADDEEWDFEEDDDEEDEEEDDDDATYFNDSKAGIVPKTAQELFWAQIQEMRNSKKQGTEKVIEKVHEEIVEKQIDTSSLPSDNTTNSEKRTAIKPKKSVKFSETNEVKEIENIWDDLRKSEAENGNSRTSQFKLSRQLRHNAPIETKTPSKETESSTDKTDEDQVIADIVERNILDAEPVSPMGAISRGASKVNGTEPLKPKTQLQDNFKDGLVKISSKKPSRFKAGLARPITKREPPKSTTTTTATTTTTSTSNSVGIEQSPIISEVSSETKQNKTSISISPENSSSSLSRLSKFASDSKLGSLKVGKPTKKTKSQVPISVPKEVNPLITNPEYNDADFEDIRETVSDDEDSQLLEELDSDSKDYGRTSAVLQRPQFTEASQPEQKVTNGDAEVKLEALNTTLDYRTLQDDMDTMAKAYVLGLYDDDIETEGQVIEELKDFEEHNTAVEAKAASANYTNGMPQSNEKIEELDKQEEEEGEQEDNNDQGPVLLDKIVERDPDELLQENSIPDDEFDITLDDTVLTTNVAVDYSRLRNKMIHQFNGGFKKSDQELEFEPTEEVKISRFKSARLGMRDAN